MFSLPEWDAYKSMTPGATIAHIVDLAERRHQEGISRQYAHVVVNFVEDCCIAKDRAALDFLLTTILKSQAEPESMVTILRCTASTRQSLTKWHATRDKILELLIDKDPPRGVKKIMAGLMEPAPEHVEPMDGLNAWESLLKEANKYQ